jgi:hypothetical protein
MQHAIEVMLVVEVETRGQRTAVKVILKSILCAGSARVATAEEHANATWTPAFQSGFDLWPNLFIKESSHTRCSCLVTTQRSRQVRKRCLNDAAEGSYLVARISWL